MVYVGLFRLGGFTMKSTYSLIGAGIGLALFLAVALLPAMLYGGYAGVMLAGGIFGTPLMPTIMTKSLIVFGMALGIGAVGSLFTVFGAVAGSVIDAAAREFVPARVSSK
jgi:hypothetical protein